MSTTQLLLSKFANVCYFLIINAFINVYYYIWTFNTLRISQPFKVLRDFFFTASEIVTLRRDKNAYIIITIIIINLSLLLVIMAFYAHVCL